jgi:hypothetical protein
MNRSPQIYACHTFSQTQNCYFKQRFQLKKIKSITSTISLETSPDTPIVQKFLPTFAIHKRMQTTSDDQEQKLDVHIYVTFCINSISYPMKTWSTIWVGAIISLKYHVNTWKIQHVLVSCWTMYTRFQKSLMLIRSYSYVGNVW